MKAKPIGFHTENLGYAVVGMKSINWRLERALADRSLYIDTLHGAILKLSDEMAILTGSKSLNNQQAITSTIDKVEAAYLAVETIVEASDYYKCARDVAIEKAKEAGSKALSAAQEVVAVGKAAKDATEEIPRAKEELDLRTKRAQELRRTISDENNTKEEKDLAQQLLAARERAVADAQRRLEALSLQSSNAGEEVNAAKQRFKAATERAAIKRADSKVKMTYNDKKRFEEVLQDRVRVENALLGVNTDEPSQAQETDEAQGTDESKGRIETHEGNKVQEKDEARRSLRAQMSTKQRKKIDTEFMNAACKGNLKKVQVLISRGADVDTRNEGYYGYGYTALMWAAEYGFLEIVDFLLAHEADIDISDRNGTTALMGAAKCGRNDVVQALISGGASLNLRNTSGKTALTMAYDRRHRRAAELLQAAGASR